MRITNESDYALRILYVLSSSNNDGAPVVINAADIAERADVSLRFALKILRKLSLAGIITSKKGSSGGYYLQKNPSAISLGEIIETIEGQIHITNCTQSDYECPRSSNPDDPCRYHHIFCELTHGLRDQLYSINLTNVLNGNFSLS